MGSSDSLDQGLLKNTMSSITKQRVKLNIKVLGVQLGAEQQNKEQGQQGQGSGEKQTFREQFKAPEMSIISKLMSKVHLELSVIDSNVLFIFLQPLLDGKDLDIELDSTADSENEDYSDDEDDDPFSNAPPKESNNQHSDPNSYAWCLMRYASITLAQQLLEKFLCLAGVEASGTLLMTYAFAKYHTFVQLVK